MKNKMPFFFALLLAAAIATPSALYGAATITIINTDGANEGFNDPTPAAPVGGNPGTTRGAQRLIVFQAAADQWGATLDSNVEIFVSASFDPLGAGVLGSAGTTFVFSDFPGSGRLFPGAAFPATWYHSALTDKLYGADGAGPEFADIVARFSSDTNFYLGLDNNHGVLNDLYAVVLHELGHGLGFANFVNEVSGANLAGQTDIFSHFTLDETTGLHWSDIPPDASGNAQRQTSAINARHVSWDGGAVRAAVPVVLSFGVPQLLVNSPGSIAGTYDVGLASFGSALTASGVTGNVVQALDPADSAGATTFDACSPLTNAAAVAGNIAILDRGTCGFVVKVKNAQDAGAIAVIVADNAVGSPPAGLGGADPAITIPSVRITQADGNTLKANLSGLNVTLNLNMSLRAGASAAGNALLWAVQPVAPGSSISHWDVIAARNQLMEPAINGDLSHSVQPPQDMTLPQLRDVGWFPDGDFDGLTDVTDACLGSNLAPTIVIQSCDSNVPNGLFTNGCTMSDHIASCVSVSRNHGQFVKCVTDQANSYKKAGIITGAQKDAIVNCAINSTLP